MTGGYTGTRALYIELYRNTPPLLPSAGAALLAEDFMNTKEHLLTCLAEECAEIQHAVSKALRFGLDDGYPGAETTNAQNVAREYVDLIAVVDLCIEHGIIGQPGDSKAIYDAKRERVKKFMIYARERGALDG